jgi:hypothetical protein
VLERLLVESDAADRAVGAFGLARLDGERAGELVWSRDPIIAQAAARAAPFVGAAVTTADRLVREPPGRTRTQLALALVDPRARARVPTGLLIELVEEQGIASPLALFALSERDSEQTRARLLEHLASPDPLLRAQVALGLGHSDDPSALGILERAYGFELEPRVRRAIVDAVVRRPENVRMRTLRLSAALEPDAATRALARLGAVGILPEAWTTGPGTLFVVLERADGAARGAVVTAPGGLALPVLADPDGVVALAGLAPGLVDLRVALLPAEGNSRGRGSR